MEYHDEANQLYGYFTFNKSKMKTQDYFTGEIRRADETVCKINGNYMGYFDIDGVRWWDRRDKALHHTPAKLFPDNLEGILPSDSNFRPDAMALSMRTVEEA